MSDIYLSEFEKLKDEQISRSAHRDRLFHLTLVLFGGGITIALTKDAQMRGLLLLLPVVAFIAGTSHIACDRRISSIGSYIKNALSKRIAQKENIPREEVFEWELFIDSDKLRSGRKWTQFLSNVFLYVVSGFGATVWYCGSVLYGDAPRSLTPIETTAAAADIGLMMLMAWQLTRHAYIVQSKDRPDRSSRTWRSAALAFGKLVVSLAAAGLATAAMLHFGPLVLQHSSAQVDLGFSLGRPVTQIEVAAAIVFVVVVGLFRLLLRRRQR